MRVRSWSKTWVIIPCQKICATNVSERHANRTIGWMGIERGHRARPLEWIVEKGIMLVSFSAIIMILLIFLFIGREAAPVLFGRMSSARADKVIPPEEMGKLSKGELQEYLELTPAQFAGMNQATFKILMEIKM